MQDLVVDQGHPIAAHVRRELATAPELRRRMLEAGARIILVDACVTCQVVDVEIQRRIDAVDLEAIALPFFVAVFALADRGLESRPFAVKAPRGELLGGIGMGEGGVMCFDANGEWIEPAEALPRLARRLGDHSR